MLRKTQRQLDIFKKRFEYAVLHVTKGDEECAKEKKQYEERP